MDIEPLNDPPEWQPPVADAQVVKEGGEPVNPLGGLEEKERNR